MTGIDLSPQETYDAFVRCRGSIRATARETGMSRGAVKYRLDKAAEMGLTLDKPVSGGVISKPPPIKMPLPPEGRVYRYIITAAQNNTDAHVPLFENLVAYADALGAKLMVGSFSYNRASYGQKSTKRGRGPTEDDRKDDWYDPIFDDYWMDEAVELAPFLQWRGELNISPTAEKPLSSLETYGGRASKIFPHSKHALQSVAMTKADGAKFIYTTGTSTMLNFIQKKTGLKAEFHHAYGAVIVEVDSEGDWFVRQLNADTDGTFYDIADFGQLGAVKVENGLVVPADPIKAVTWGDIHARVLDPAVKKCAFGPGGMLDALRPEEQHLHDVLDFTSKSHHDMKNAHRMYQKKALKWDDVADEIEEVGETLNVIRRDWCQTVIADANHDRHLQRWLNECDYRTDHKNALFILEAELAYRRAISENPYNNDYNFLQEALIRQGFENPDIWLGIDDSWVICDDGSGGIECSLHGDIGPNGSRGAPLGLSKMGRRANTGHTHSAAIIDGLFVGGTSSLLVQDWNKGPSSWSHSHIVTYPNGKRTIVTMFNGKWRATT